MTTAKLVASPPQGSGLVGQLVERHYADLVQGKPGEHLVVAAVMQPVGTSSRRTKEGIHTTTTYELVRLEVMRDSHDADHVQWLITRAHDQRHGGAQETLPLSSPSELRESTLRAIAEWSAEHGLTPAQVDERWSGYFGGPEHASSATVEHGSLVQLREFAHHIGALSDDGPAGQEPDEDEQDDPERDSEQAPAAHVAAVTFSGGAS